MEKLCDIEIELKCGFCNKIFKNPRLWETCNCGAKIMFSYKAVATKYIERKEWKKYDDNKRFYNEKPQDT